jgi:hypothetical protein
MRSAYRILVGKLEVKIFGIPKHRGESNIKTEIECEGVDWMQFSLEKDHWRVIVIMVMNLQVP